MLEPRSLIRTWGPPSAVVDEVTGDVSINIGGVVVATCARAYDARQRLADNSGEMAPLGQTTAVLTAGGTTTLGTPPNPNPRQIETVPPAEALGPGANMAATEPDAKNQQLPPAQDEEHHMAEVDEVTPKKKSLTAKFLGGK